MEIEHIVVQYTTSNDRGKPHKGLFAGGQRVSKRIVQTIFGKNDGGMYALCQL
jgi:hypothetical protein